ncbi:ribonuclease P protein subunit p38 isoform X3 [Cephus cinctus]|uniref:Ribonuclease P protein subunit p38 isoform X3 n=1 Tax=Cephus cinctus TaxID=211228 RepID=A0AAJ7RTQ4_CEPCN|nr:ribonuclease P protein subunit p38 isoform X3 [Cephus cinctus]
MSKKQQKKSLSSKKGPTKGLRNVLVQPFDNYWPVLEDDKDASLKNLLKRLLVVLKRNPVNISWAKLKKMTKEERLVAKEAAKTEVSTLADQKIINSTVIGVNAVTRSLEKNAVCCVLLDANVEPVLLIKHIVNMALKRNVPVLLIPFLKSVTVETMNFATAAIAFKNNVAKDEANYFHELFKKIVDLAANYPVPDKAVKLLQEDTESQNKELLHNNSCVETDHSTDTDKSIKLFTVSTNVYKYRTSRNERVFIPENAMEIQTPGKVWTDFIAVDQSVDTTMKVDNKGKMRKNKRYMDIHEKNENSPTVSKSAPMDLGDFISFESQPKMQGAIRSILLYSNFTIELSHRQR